MKAKDIKPGEVYAYRPSKYGRIIPVVLLAPADKDNLYVSQPTRRKSGDPWYPKAPRATKPSRGSGYSDPSYGYPAVMPLTEKGDLAVLRGVTLADFEAATQREDHERGITFMLLDNVAHIVGPYEEIIAAEAEARAAEMAERQAKSDREAEVRARALDLIVALNAHGVKAGRADTAGGGTVLTLRLGEVDKLLALLPADTKET